VKPSGISFSPYSLSRAAPTIARCSACAMGAASVTISVS
jgi:hypothetical protein